MTGEEADTRAPRPRFGGMGWVLVVGNAILLVDFTNAYEEAGSTGRRTLLYAALVGTLVGLAAGLIGAVAMRWNVRRTGGEGRPSQWGVVGPAIGVVVFVLLRNQGPALRHGAFVAMIVGADVYITAVILALRREEAEHGRR